MSEILLTGSDYSEPVSFIGLYSDDTPMVKSDNFAEMVKRADTMTLRPKSLMDFTVAMFLVDAISAKGGKVKTLVLPYVPGARQDRVNPTGDVLDTARSVARMINDRDFSQVVILDPHSPVTPESIRRVDVYPLEYVADKMWQGYTGIISADKGGQRRAMQFATAMNLPIYYGGKTRDVTTGRLTGFELEEIPFGHYLVVDDICDGGGTFIGLGEKIREQGSFADLYVTHGIFSKGTDELKKIYKNIYTTDSREINERNDVLIIEVVEEMRNYND